MSLSENFCRLSFFWRIGRKLGFYPDSSFGIDSICIRCRFDPGKKTGIVPANRFSALGVVSGFGLFGDTHTKRKKMFRTKNDLIWSHSSEWKENNLCVQSYSNDPDLAMKPMIMTIWRKFTLFRSECSTGTTLALNVKVWLVPTCPSIDWYFFSVQFRVRIPILQSFITKQSLYLLDWPLREK